MALRATAGLAVSLLLGLLVTGCGQDEPSVEDAAAAPGPPLVDGLERSTRVLDRDGLAADALRPARLARLLDDSDYSIGLEEEYTGRTDLYSHVVSRRLEFKRTEGASQYVEWLRANAADLLGTAKPPTTFDAGPDGFVTRDAGCGCHSDLPTFLAAWRDGSIVHTLLADGMGVDRPRFVALARQLG
jgi:hypothetical protein